MARASQSAGPTGANLLRLLELRVDKVAFRLGLAPTIPAADPTDVPVAVDVRLVVEFYAR